MPEPSRVARVDCVYGDLIKRMHNAGCGGMFFGIESGSERMQKVIKGTYGLAGELQLLIAAKITTCGRRLP
jgi:radical SAM superfamily enzyme YgiQ (UPF0313 family)